MFASGYKGESLDEKLVGNEVDDFFDKVHKLGITKLKDLRDFLERKDNGEGKEKEKLDDYSNITNPNNIQYPIEENKINEDLIPREPTSENGPKIKDTGVAQLLIDAINGEWDTIKLYNDIVTNLEEYGYKDISDVIKDIVIEENIHIGQLQKALETISPNVSSIEDGVKEAEGQLTDTTEANTLNSYEKD